MSTPLRIKQPAKTATAHQHRLWEMTPEQRVQAMWERRLTFKELREWTSRRPSEVPLLGGEFAWIVMHTPEWAEAGGQP